MKHLLIFTIGPVQSFIASARKTQDLFAGSGILSNLVKKAYSMFIEDVKKKNGTVKLIFPILDTNAGVEKAATNPNRFAVIIEGLSANNIKDVVSKIKRDLIEEDFVSDVLEKTGFNDSIAEIAEKQLIALPEIYWGALPLADDLNDYQKRSEELESYIGAIKNVRVLKQTNETGRKCNVDGVNNVVVYRKSGARDNTRKLHLTVNSQVIIAEKADERTFKIWDISPGEGLSAISFYKRRFFSQPHKFPSTAKVALMHILEREEVKELPSFLEYQKIVGSNGSLFKHSDDQLFYDENIRETVFRENKDYGDENDPENNDRLKADLKQVRKARETLCQELRNTLNITEDFSSKYYALLMFDGDRIGEWLGGEHLEDKSKLLAFQVKLGELLHSFASYSGAYLNEPLGKAVYSAGEDFLGFVNLNHLFSVLSELRLKFDEMVFKELQKEQVQFKIKQGVQLTFSAGIAIAHYKQPLSTVLEEARIAEKQAKAELANSFCISIIRHSGGITRCVLPFDDALDSYVRAMETIVTKLKKDEFSNTFIYQLIRETQIWDGANPRELFDIEAMRLISRACNYNMALTETNEQFQERREQGLSLMAGAVNRISKKDISASLLSKSDLENTLSTLRICDFVQRSQKALDI